MHLSVAFLPSLVTKPIRDVCVVVDVLRASSTLATLFDRGCRTVVVTPDVASARACRRDDRLLCGEQGRLPPEGFDHGNSPAEMSNLALHGRDVVFCTSNGTVALHAVQVAPAVLVGSLLNRRAVARAALALARQLDTGITVVCAGRGHGTRYALDDAYCAGAIVAGIQASVTVPLDLDLDLDDTALGALALSRAGLAAESSQTNPDAVERARAVFRASDSGRHLLKLGLQADVDYCTRYDRSDTVPWLALVGGELVLTPLGAVGDAPPPAPGPA